MSASASVAATGPRRALLRRARKVSDLYVAPATTARFERHLQRTLPRLRNLQSEGHDNANVLAILAVESFFRPRLVRGIEYLAWFAMSLWRRQTVCLLSVGTAQAKLEHWRAFGLLESERFSPRGLAKVTRLPANYDLCRRFLGSRRALHEPDLHALALAYTGGSRRQYVELLSTARTAVKSTVISSVPDSADFVS